jgi:hypothetical protein
MNRSLIVLHALATGLILTSGAEAGDKAGPRDTIVMERTHAPMVRYAALDIDAADLAAHSKPSKTCSSHRAGPRDSVRMHASC